MEHRRVAPEEAAAARLRRILLIGTIFGLLLAGVFLRRVTWEKTRHLRFQGDIVNAFYWGNETLKQGARLSPQDTPNSWSALGRGYLTLYDHVIETSPDGNYALDYPPLRLLVMSLWAREVRAYFPGVDDGTPDYVQPLLHVNLFCELMSAVGIFLLVRLGLRQASRNDGSLLLHRLAATRRAWICGLIAATAAWFEPSLILDAHAWPQWDAWILPLYLFASLAAMTRRWFWCGCLLAAGGMFKGQLLFVAPFFLIWPLWQKRWVRALRFVAGFVATAALVVSPWLLRNPLAWGMTGVAAAVAAAFFRWRRSRNTWAWTAGLAAVVAFVVGALDGGSFAWLRVGFLYGSEHYPFLFISSCYNLPSLLADRGWSLKDPFLSCDIGNWRFDLTLQWTLRSLYGIGLTLCALLAARHTRFRNPRLLVTLAAPWLLMFALLGQMHERYLLWGAVVSALALAVNLRLSLLHFLFSGLSAAMIVHVLLIDKKLSPVFRGIDLLNSVRPYASWIFLAAVGLWIWTMIGKPTRSGLVAAKPAKQTPLAISTPVEEM